MRNNGSAEGDERSAQRGEISFQEDRRVALRDFWVVYEDRYDAITAATMRLAEKHVEFAPLIAAMTPEQIAKQNEESREQLRRAIEGDWEPYERNLRAQGSMYAGMGLSFAAWYDIIRAFHGEIVPCLVDAYVATPSRLSAALLALQDFLDHAMVIIAEQYLETKERMILQAEARNAAVIEAAIDPIVTIDSEGAITQFNPAAERTFGFARSDVLGRPLVEVLVPSSLREAQRQNVGTYLAAGNDSLVGQRVERVAMRADGTEIPVEIAIVAIPDVGGRPCFTGFLRDITDRKRAEEALAVWKHVFEQSEIGIAVSDVETNALQFLNVAYAEMHGYAVEELVGQQSFDVAPNELRTNLRESLRHIESKRHRTFETTHVRKDGTEIPVLVSRTVARTGHGRAFVVTSVIDQTERKRAERASHRSVELEAQNRRIQEASRLKSEFLANMSHELRTPLNSILGFAEVLLDGEVDPSSPEHKEYLGDILTSGRHLLQLINDVLDLAKVEAGKLEFHPEAIELASIVGEVTAILRTTAATRRVRLDVRIDPSIGELTIDPARLKQVLYNYLSNALKFTPAGGAVTVRAVPEGLDVFRLEVEDTGIGIAPADLGRLFIEFQQLDGGVAKRHGGTGLGLALTKRLVEAQGGTVGVRSTLGRGSVFHALLPRRLRDGSPLPEPQVIEAADVDAPRILVIEDDAQDQKLVMAALASAGYAVETVATGAQALARCRDTRFDAITLDLLLPDMNGLDILAAVREGSLNQEARVIVVSVIAERGAVAGCTVDDILSKPVDERLLVDALARAGVRPRRSGRVLVVDDDASSRKLMEVTLAARGYRVECCANGEAALRSAAEQRPDAVVLDLLMPEMDGMEFLVRFRAMPDTRHVPVIVWTVKTLSGQERQRLRESTHAIVEKGRHGTSSLVEEIAAVLPRRSRSEVRHDV